jgi:hypothetical protein
MVDCYRPQQSANVAGTRHCLVCTRLSDVSIDRKLLISVQRIEIGLEPINTTPTGHFKVWELKQHIKAYSRHIQGIPTTSIHWNISYTIVGPHQKPHKCHKREIKQERATHVCATSCDHLSMEFWLPFIVKLARAPYLCGWPCGDFCLLLTKKNEHSSVLVTVGERERVDKDPSLVDSSMGIRFLVNQTSVKQITRVTCVYCLWFVCLLPL